MHDLRRLAHYLGPYRKDMIIGALLIIAETCFELFIPMLMADLIDIGAVNHDISYILWKGVQMGACAILSLITGLLYARFAARAAYGWGSRIREVSVPPPSVELLPTVMVVASRAARSLAVKPLRKPAMVL